VTTDGNLPAVFSEAEVDLGDRETLVSLVKELLRSSVHQVQHPVYEFLTKWPFACYLTTNYDDELQRHLVAIGKHYQVIQNTRADLGLLRDNVDHLIVKIHSDLEHPQDVILTSSDYVRVSSSPDGAYLRDKLRQVFEMFDIVIVGHSMKDPDLKLILQAAKNTASAIHPIYMILANATRGEVREFREHYNIRLISYRDHDGTHSQLRGMIRVADRFICPREAHVPTGIEVTDEEIKAATSLLIFRRVRAIAQDEPIDGMLGPVLLSVLSQGKKPLSLGAIVTRRFKLGHPWALQTRPPVGVFLYLISVVSDRLFLFSSSVFPSFCRRFFPESPVLGRLSARGPVWLGP